MKTQAQIESHVKDLLLKELQARLDFASRRLPHVCQHNHRQPLDPRHEVDGEPNENYNRVTQNKRGLPVLQTMGLCMLNAQSPEDWSGTLCEEPADAQRCPDFLPTLSKEKVYGQFCKDMANRSWFYENHPELYALLWVLDQVSVGWPYPLWLRVWYWFKRVKIEKQRPPLDLKTLLPGPPEG